jgi:tyrosinase
MRTVEVLTIAASLASAALGYPTEEAASLTCENPRIRVEWREMNPSDQQNYIDSVLCLKTKPSRIGTTATLYDDFPYIHYNLSPQSMFDSS